MKRKQFSSEYLSVLGELESRFIVAVNLANPGYNGENPPAIQDTPEINAAWAEYVMARDTPQNYIAWAARQAAPTKRIVAVGHKPPYGDWQIKAAADLAETQEYEPVGYTDDMLSEREHWRTYDDMTRGGW